MGILGCCLLSDASVGETLTRFKDTQPFYDLRHVCIFRALAEMHKAGEPIDMIVLQERLKQWNRLEEVGGLAYLSGLPDTVPSAAHLEYYLEIVFEKFLLRKMMTTCTEVVTRIYTHERDVPLLLDEVSRDIVRISELGMEVSRNSGKMPQFLKDLTAFEQEYWDMWFGAQSGEPGLPLPDCFGDFPFKVRGGEMSFVIAEKGAGKSTLLSYVLLHLMSHGQKACIASMEQRPGYSLKMMAAQLLGRTTLPDNDWGHKAAIAAYDWLRSRLLIYNFLGIAEWRDILASFEFASAWGCGQFLIDSIMRLGIVDDDYPEQGQAAKTLSNWAQSRDAHLWVVNHLNKSDRSTKQRSRGSQQWIDNSHNVMSIHRNEEKHAKIDELKEQKIKNEISEEMFNEKIYELSTKYDSYFDLHNQRWQGSRQNGRRYLYFNRNSLQLFERPYDESTNWLAVWQKDDAHKKEREAP